MVFQEVRWGLGLPRCLVARWSGDAPGGQVDGGQEDGGEGGEEAPGEGGPGEVLVGLHLWEATCRGTHLRLIRGTGIRGLPGDLV